MPHRHMTKPTKPRPKKKAATKKAAKRVKAPDVSPDVSPAPDNPGENLGVVTPARKAVPLIPQPHGGALQRGGTNPGGGRPPDRTRAVFRELLREKLAPKAVEVVGRSKDARLHLEALDRFAAIGFNEKMRTEKMRAEGKATAAAAAQAGASSNVQVHVSGGPTGLERPNGGEVANG